MKSMLSSRTTTYGIYKCNVSMTLKEMKRIVEGDTETLMDHLKRCIAAAEKMPEQSSTNVNDEA